MNWSEVGSWIKDNAGTGAALIGSMVSGNVPGAIAAGVSLISGATGTDDPAQALYALQNDPATVVKLRELYIQNEQNVRSHIESMTRLKLEDEQASHLQTQLTIRNGDNSQYPFVRFTRPAQSWTSLVAALYYALFTNAPSAEILFLLLTLPWAYAGLRQIGKGITSFTTSKPIQNIVNAAGKK